jgi:hypothetical protein
MVRRRLFCSLPPVSIAGDVTLVTTQKYSCLASCTLSIEGTYDAPLAVRLTPSLLERYEPLVSRKQFTRRASASVLFGWTIFSHH